MKKLKVKHEQVMSPNLSFTLAQLRTSRRNFKITNKVLTPVFEFLKRYCWQSWQNKLWKEYIVTAATASKIEVSLKLICFVKPNRHGSRCGTQIFPILSCKLQSCKLHIRLQLGRRRQIVIFLALTASRCLLRNLESRSWPCCQRVKPAALTNQTSNYLIQYTKQTK